VLVQEPPQRRDVLVVDDQWLRHADVAAASPATRSIVPIAAVSTIAAITTVSAVATISAVAAVISIKGHRSLLLWGR
jgi:hypothetical protein